jgi:hypothetical protein
MMKRIVTTLILLVLATGVAAQEVEVTNRPLDVNVGFLHLGAEVRLEMEGTTNDAYEFTIVVDPTEDVIWTIPPAQGVAGTQLQTTAGGDLSWSAAGSLREYKEVTGLIDPEDALSAILSAPVHRFQYKPGGAVTTGDYTTEYVGILAEEAPWAMHQDGTILNPVNTVGYAFGAIQALDAQVKALEALVETLKAQLDEQTGR